MRTVLFFVLAAVIVSGCRSPEKPLEEQPQVAHEPSPIRVLEETPPSVALAEELPPATVVEAPPPVVPEDPEIQALEEQINRLQKEVAALKARRDQVLERNERRLRSHRDDIEDASETLDALEAIAKEEAQ